MFNQVPGYTYYLLGYIILFLLINESAAVLQKAINIKRLIKNGLFTREGCSCRSSPICRHTQSTATYRPRVYLINSPYDGTHSPDRKLRLFMQCENYDLKDHYLLASKPQMEPFKRGDTSLFKPFVAVTAN